MKVGDIMNKCSARPFNLKGLKPKDFIPFRKFLEESGYTRDGLFGRLKARDLYETHHILAPVYNEIYLKEENNLNLLIILFFISARMPEEKARELFGKDIFDFLMHVGILSKDETGCKATIDIFPCRGRYIATDHRYETLCPKNTVYPLGVDSYGLARAITERPTNQVLDLCTGSGVQGIIAARYAKQVTCVDINFRALEFVKLNALLNGLTNVRAIHGNLYKAVKDKKFDLILANPPFVPSPEKKKLLFRDGSASGDSVLREIVAGLPEHLEPGGSSQIYTLIPVTDREFNDKVKGWLQQKPFHVLTLIHLVTDNFFFLRSHVSPMRDVDFYQKIVNWSQSLIDEGIKKVSYGIINLAHAIKTPPQIRHKDYQLPFSSYWEKVDTQLFVMENRENPAYLEELMKTDIHLSRDTDKHWEGIKTDGSKVYGFKFADGSFFEQYPLDRDQKTIIELIARGVTRGSEIKAEFEKAGGTEFNRKLMDLLEYLVLETA